MENQKVDTMEKPQYKDRITSIDIEGDGQLLGIENSMVQLGAVTYDDNGKEIDSFVVNMLDFPGCKSDSDTMEWWKKQKTYEQVFSNRVPPKEGMEKFLAFLKKNCKEDDKIVLLAYPSGYDFAPVYNYLYYFTKERPFWFRCIDIKSYATAKLNIPYCQLNKETTLAPYCSDLPHTHDALDDAREQGALYWNLRNNIKPGEK